MHRTPIRLRREGDDTIVEIDCGVPNRDGETFVEVIRERYDAPFSHIVESSGIERAMDYHYNGKFLPAE